jgi:NADH-quinone oxidoreductase subunit M
VILTAITFLPLVGALVCMLLPRDEAGLLRGVTLSVTLINFALSLFLLNGFDVNDWSFVVDVAWIQSLGVHYHLGVDGISLWLVLLTTFLMPVVMLSSHGSITKKVREFCIAMLVLETGMIGTFLALDLFFFYVFWEIMLVPMYFIIGIWGGDRRLYASIKFVIYTMVGSLLMVVAILYLYIKGHDALQVWTFDYNELARVVLSPEEQLLCFGAFALAFCIKVPLFPLHTWLPDAHVEAPTAGSVILAAVLLKFGTYGLLRFAIPFFPSAFTRTAPLLAVLAVIGIVYGSMVAFAQKDMKKLIAYSSVAHLGFVVLGLAMWNAKAIDGAVAVMLAHGISTGGLFLCIGVIYDRRHTRRIDEFGGIAAVMPRFTAVFMIMTFASIGLPGLCGFVGEFLVLSGTFGAYKSWAGQMSLFPHPKVLAGIATTGVILAAMYMLFLFQKVMFGPLTNSRNKDLRDLNAREMVVFAPMVLMAFWLGIYPNTFLSSIDPSVKRTMGHMQAKMAIPVEEGMQPKAVPIPEKPVEEAAPAAAAPAPTPPPTPAPDAAEQQARDAAKIALPPGLRPRPERRAQ